MKIGTLVECIDDRFNAEQLDELLEEAFVEDLGFIEI